jgi:nicotinamide phosphoribosyltransferase
LKDQCTWEEEKQGLLQVVFENGKLVNEQSLKEIRARVNSNL